MGQENAATSAKKNWFGRHKIFTAVLVIVVIGIISSASKSPTTSPSAGSSTAANQPKTEEPQKLYAVNEDVRVGDVRWKVLDVRDRGTELRKSESRYPSIARSKTTTGKFVQVRFEVENLGSDLKSLTDLSVVDEQGRIYVASTDTSEWVPESEQLFLLANINPNVPKTYTAIYEVAVGAAGLKLKVGDLDLLKHGEALVSLGL